MDENTETADDNTYRYGDADPKTDAEPEREAKRRLNSGIEFHERPPTE